MKILPLLLLISPILFAGDHEVDLLFSKEGTRSYTWLGINGADLNPEKPTSIGLRFGFTQSLSETSSIQYQMGYHAKASAEIPSFNYWNAYGYNINRPSDLKIQSFSLGAQLQWRSRVQLGLGAEVRTEHLAMGSVSTSQTRPWVNTRLAYPFGGSSVRPIIGIEFAIPITEQGQPKTIFDASGVPSGPEKEGLMKRLSPNQEIGAFIGIRF
jgi:hypothetical protein